MYQQHWGLRSTPFRSQANRYFASAAQEEAVARIQFLIDNNRRLGLLTGAAGLGKSSILDYVAQQRDCQGSRASRVNVLGLDCHEFVFLLAESIGTQLEAEAAPAFAWRRIFDQFLANHYQKIHTVILLDDLHEADADVLTAVVRLSQWRPADDVRFTIVLTCHCDRVALVGRRLLELCELSVELEPWDRVDTAGYLAHALQAAGAQRSVFDEAAIDEIQRISQGNPRRIGQLAELALVAGAATEMQRIDPAIVVAVQEELSVVSAVPFASTS